MLGMNREGAIARERKNHRTPRCQIQREAQNVPSKAFLLPPSELLLPPVESLDNNFRQSIPKRFLISAQSSMQRLADLVRKELLAATYCLLLLFVTTVPGSALLLFVVI